MVFFFFQAEDGIRDVAVTGVQTCALPIFGGRGTLGARFLGLRLNGSGRLAVHADRRRRSEERRVGKSVDLGGRRIIKKKKNNAKLLKSHREKHSNSRK